MLLLHDYAITPDVFDTNSYTNDEVCAARLETIREAILYEGLVRDLRNGDWGKVFLSKERQWHSRGKELVKKLASQGRLVRHSPALPDSPRNDVGWCAEALKSHVKNPYKGGIIATQSVKNTYTAEGLVSRIDRLSSAPWWNTRSSSVTLKRSKADYITHLDLILRVSNSIQFIDPYLSPDEPRYRCFKELLNRSGHRSPAPTVEIHRACYNVPGQGGKSYFESRFADNLNLTLQSAGLRAKVFIWDNFHDRYLISNLVGISLPNGFDTGGRHIETRWTRLDRRDRDDVQREFDPASQRHKLMWQFSIP